MTNFYAMSVKLYSPGEVLRIQAGSENVDRIWVEEAKHEFIDVSAIFVDESRRRWIHSGRYTVEVKEGL
jgi:hypothetical protein